MNNNKKIIKIISGYSFSEAIAKGLNWLLLILLPKIISPEEYGVVGLLIAFEQFVFPVLIGGHHTFVLRFFNRFKEFEDRFLKSVFISWGQYVLVVFPIILILSICFLKLNYLLVLIVVVFLAFREIIINYLRVKEDIKTYFWIRAVFQILKFVAVILFSYTVGGNNLYAYALIVAVSVHLIQLFLISKNRMMKVKNSNSVKRIPKIVKKFGIPIVFHALSISLLAYLNRYMIAYFIDTESVGLFTFAYSISYSLFFIVFILSITFQPILYKAKTFSERSENFLRLYTNIVYALIYVVSLVLFFGYQYFLTLYPQNYSESINTFRILLLSMLSMPFYHMGNFRSVLKNKTLFLPISTGIAVGVNFLLNILFIPRYGIEGASIALLISNGILILIINIFSRGKEMVTKPNPQLLLIITAILSSIIFYELNLIETLYYIYGGILIISIPGMIKKLQDYKSSIIQ